MANKFPPRRRDWNSGTAQAAAFLRTRQGSTIRWSNDAATDHQETLMLALLLVAVAPRTVPDEIMSALKTWVDSQIDRKAV